MYRTVIKEHFEFEVDFSISHFEGSMPFPLAGSGFTDSMPVVGLVFPILLTKDKERNEQVKEIIMFNRVKKITNKKIAKDKSGISRDIHYMNVTFDNNVVIRCRFVKID